MLKELIKIANNLDNQGLKALASELDEILIRNKSELKKLAGVEVPAWEAMAHEDHSPIEETTEFAQFEQEEQYKQWEAAERVAKLVVGGTPVFGEDPETGRRVEDDLAQELADVLSKNEHTKTVMAILDFIEGD